jgi:hypothetical protein
MEIHMAAVAPLALKVRLAFADAHKTDKTGVGWLSIPLKYQLAK